jgi:hypothetical protein
MSAYITLATPMIDQDCLLSALAEVGLDRSKLEVHETPVNLVGYQGDSRIQTANIVIRRRHVGSASNDIGFLRTPTGYRAYVSGYDNQRHGNDWLARLKDHYYKHWAAKQARLAEEERRRVEAERARVVEAQRQSVYERAKKLGYRVKETKHGETIRLELVKRTY